MEGYWWKHSAVVFGLLFVLRVADTKLQIDNLNDGPLLATVAHNLTCTVNSSVVQNTRIRFGRCEDVDLQEGDVASFDLQIVARSNSSVTAQVPPSAFSGLYFAFFTCCFEPGELPKAEDDAILVDLCLQMPPPDVNVSLIHGENRKAIRLSMSTLRAQEKALGCKSGSKVHRNVLLRLEQNKGESINANCAFADPNDNYCEYEMSVHRKFPSRIEYQVDDTHVLERGDQVVQMQTVSRSGVYNSLDLDYLQALEGASCAKEGNSLVVHAANFNNSETLCSCSPLLESLPQHCFCDFIRPEMAPVRLHCSATMEPLAATLCPSSGFQLWSVILSCAVTAVLVSFITCIASLVFFRKSEKTEETDAAHVIQMPPIIRSNDNDQSNSPLL